MVMTCIACGVFQMNTDFLRVTSAAFRAMIDQDPKSTRRILPKRCSFSVFLVVLMFRFIHFYMSKAKKEKS